MWKKWLTVEDKQNLKNIATANIHQVIANYAGVYPPRSCYDGTFRMECPLHEGAQSQTSFCWYPQTGTWTCFGDCGKTGNVITFIEMIKGWNYGQVMDDLAVLFNYNPENTTSTNIIDTSVQPEVIHVEPIRLLKETELLNCNVEHDYWKRIPKEIKEYLGGGYCNVRTHKLYGRVTFPARDEYGRLVGISGRCASTEPPIDMYEKRKEGWYREAEGTDSKRSGVKYLNYGAGNKTGFRLGAILFNLNNAKYYNSMPLLLVEGQFDVAMALTHGYGAVVGTMGSAVTPIQWGLITKYFNSVIYAYDSDTFVRTEKTQLSKYDRFLLQAKERDIKVFTLTLPDNIDVGSSTESQFLYALRRALN